MNTNFELELSSSSLNFVVIAKRVRRLEFICSQLAKFIPRPLQLECCKLAPNGVKTSQPLKQLFHQLITMKSFICMMTLFSSMPPQLLFDFTKKSNIEDWRVVDDVVMGGVSAGSFTLDSDGFGVFEGAISLENNGGFSSVRYRFPKVKTAGYSKIVIKLKGDGKKYQFRIKTNSGDSHSFIAPFSTSGEWEEIEISLQDMYPAFRGRTLEQPNFSDAYFEEIAFLIGNKKKEQFKLLIDRIELK